jgi:type III restriction enzyme
MTSNELILRDIKQRLGLRLPLQESLDLLDKLCQEAHLGDLQDPLPLEDAVKRIAALYPDSFQSFERGFPSVTYSIATGVGKTRLMAAIVLYLYRSRGIRNFFILAPNLTIYNKLIRDFGDPGYEKYVFNGVPEFVTNRPVVITGDNYAQQGGLFHQEEVRINIFNIAKFNADTKTSKKEGKVQQPRIKRLSEYLGQSYWQFLSKQHDLVVLMDEAHRYRADASRNAIEELKPLLGIELTATPFDAAGNPFKNVVYEYTLARALADGQYVKIPAVATRKDFNFNTLSPEDTDKLKLEDGISVHRDTQQALDLYARDNNKAKVKPFVLVACRDIEHARSIFEFVNSTIFYDGAYTGKVLQVDSSKDDSEIEKLLTVERADNPIEIVIHVGMLKEGWDVNNLYTIVPLRAANSLVLIEQTLGRGLRLPYGGERTGVEKVDMVTVIAHDNFEKVVAAAQDSGSIFQKMKQIVISPETIGQVTEVVTSQNTYATKLALERKRATDIKDEQERQKMFNALDAKSMIAGILPRLNGHAEVKKYEDLLKPEVQARALEILETEVTRGQTNLFALQIVAEAQVNYGRIVAELRENIIEVPQFVVQYGPARVWFEDFDLDIEGFALSKLDLEIERRHLTDPAHRDTLRVVRNNNLPSPEHMLMSKLLDYSEIDPDEHVNLRFKLVNQAVAALKTSAEGTDKDLRETVYDRLGLLAEKIYVQLIQHFHVEETGYQVSTVLPFTRIEPWNFSLYKNYGRKHFRETAKVTSDIPKYLYFGFLKACHLEYKFQSKAEKDFAQICEEDASVLRWMRPSKQQFKIYWNRHDQYQPDFIVETSDRIFLCEPKSTGEIDSPEVRSKTKAALKFCAEATTFSQANGGKSWDYLLIPHTDIIPMQRSFSYFATTYLKITS